MPPMALVEATRLCIVDDHGCAVEQPLHVRLVVERWVCPFPNHITANPHADLLRLWSYMWGAFTIAQRSGNAITG